MNIEFNRFIEVSGGPIKASKKLKGCSTTLISKIKHGEREVSKSLAKQIVDRYPGEFSLYKLLYGEK